MEVNTLSTSRYDIEEMVMAPCANLGTDNLLEQYNGDVAAAAAAIQAFWEEEVDADGQLRDQDGDILDYVDYAESFLRRSVEENA